MKFKKEKRAKTGGTDAGCADLKRNTASPHPPSSCSNTSNSPLANTSPTNSSLIYDTFQIQGGYKPIGDDFGNHNQIQHQNPDFFDLLNHQKLPPNQAGFTQPQFPLDSYDPSLYYQEPPAPYEYSEGYINSSRPYLYNHAPPTYSQYQQVTEDEYTKRERCLSAGEEDFAGPLPPQQPNSSFKSDLRRTDESLFIGYNTPAVQSNPHCESDAAMYRPEVVPDQATIFWETSQPPSAFDEFQPASVEENNSFTTASPHNLTQL